MTTRFGFCIVALGLAVGVLASAWSDAVRGTMHQPLPCLVALAHAASGPSPDSPSHAHTAYRGLSFHVVDGRGERVYMEPIPMVHSTTGMRLLSRTGLVASLAGDPSRVTLDASGKPADIQGWGCNPPQAAVLTTRSQLSDETTFLLAGIRETDVVRWLPFDVAKVRTGRCRNSDDPVGKGDARPGKLADFHTRLWEIADTSSQWFDGVREATELPGRGQFSVFGRITADGRCKPSETGYVDSDGQGGVAVSLTRALGILSVRRGTAPAWRALLRDATWYENYGLEIVPISLTTGNPDLTHDRRISYGGC